MSNAMYRRGVNVPMHERMALPYNYLGAEQNAKEEHLKQLPPTTAQSTATVDNLSDNLIYFSSLFLREFVSTICLLVLASRLGSDLFIAGPIVALYINIVFRRPLNNPFVSMLACMSSGEWRKANVAGYPGFSREKTHWWEMLLFWVWLVAAQLSGAWVAAAARVHSDEVLGHEFIKNAAWGSGQLRMMANLADSESCWRKAYNESTTGIMEIPARLYRETDSTMFSPSCLADIQWRWWFMEEVGAVLFLIVGYIHIWRWLRWDDMVESNPAPSMEKYWEKIVTFSVASASLGMMNTIAFPTAHAGWHTSLYLYGYQTMSGDKHVTSTNLHEPMIRAFGGFCGCLLAVVYEWVVAWVSTPRDSAEDAKTGGWLDGLGEVLHKILYIMPTPAPSK